MTDWAEPERSTGRLSLILERGKKVHVHLLLDPRVRRWLLGPIHVATGFDRWRYCAEVPLGMARRASKDCVGTALRILHVAPAYPPAFEYGGPVAVAFNMCGELRKRGHDVSVLTAAAHAPSAPRAEVIDGVVVSRVSNHRIKTLALSPVDMRTGLATELNQFDLVHAHELRTWMNAAVLPVANKVGLPVVLTIHGTANRRSLAYPKKALDAVLFRRLVRRSALTLALTSEEVALVRQLFGQGTSVAMFPNGVSSPPRELGCSTMQVRRKLGIRSDVDILLFLGRIDRTKRIDLLIGAFARIKATYANSELVIAGPDWGARSRLRSLASLRGVLDAVHFVGPVFGDAKQALLQTASVFVTPAYVGFPVALLEAALAGLPLVTTSLGDHLPWLCEVGHVVAPSEEGIRKAVVDILTDERSGKVMGERGRELIRGEFLWPALVRRLETIYRDILGGAA